MVSNEGALRRIEGRDRCRKEAQPSAGAAMEVHRMNRPRLNDKLPMGLLLGKTNGHAAMENDLHQTPPKEVAEGRWQTTK